MKKLLGEVLVSVAVNKEDDEKGSGEAGDTVRDEGCSDSIDGDLQVCISSCLDLLGSRMPGAHVFTPPPPNVGDERETKGDTCLQTHGTLANRRPPAGVRTACRLLVYAPECRRKGKAGITSLSDCSRDQKATYVSMMTLQSGIKASSIGLPTTSVRSVDHRSLRPELAMRSRHLGDRVSGRFMSSEWPHATKGSDYTIRERWGIPHRNANKSHLLEVGSTVSRTTGTGTVRRPSSERQERDAGTVRRIVVPTVGRAREHDTPPPPRIRVSCRTIERREMIDGFVRPTETIGDKERAEQQILSRRAHYYLVVGSSRWERNEACKLGTHTTVCERNSGSNGASEKIDKIKGDISQAHNKLSAIST